MNGITRFVAADLRENHAIDKSTGTSQTEFSQSNICSRTQKQGS